MQVNDPSRTHKIARIYEEELIFRYNRLAQDIHDYVIESWDKELKFSESDKPLLIFDAPNDEDPKFRRWFRSKVKEGISGSKWSKKYTDAAYRKGIRNSYSILKTAKSFDEVQAIQKQAAHVTASEKAFKRNHSGLGKINAAISTKISSHVAEGVLKDLKSDVVAKKIKKDVQGISASRARMLARTEMASAQAEGTLATFKEAGVAQVKNVAEFNTAGDGNVCARCEALSGMQYSIEEAHGIIPVHPNCRCTWIPVELDEEDIDFSEDFDEPAVNATLLPVERKQRVFGYVDPEPPSLKRVAAVKAGLIGTRFITRRIYKTIAKPNDMPFAVGEVRTLRGSTKAALNLPKSIGISKKKYNQSVTIELRGGAHVKYLTGRAEDVIELPDDQRIIIESIEDLPEGGQHIIARTIQPPDELAARPPLADPAPPKEKPVPRTLEQKRELREQKRIDKQVEESDRTVVDLTPEQEIKYKHDLANPHLAGDFKSTAQRIKKENPEFNATLVNMKARGEIRDRARKNLGLYRISEDDFIETTKQRNLWRKVHQEDPFYIKSFDPAIQEYNKNKVIFRNMTSPITLPPERKETFEKLMQLVEPIQISGKVYGGLVQKRALKKGQVLDNTGFISTSRIARNSFDPIRDRPVKTIYEIQLEKGKTRGIVTNAKDAEVIIAPGQKLKVESVTRNLRMEARGKDPIIIDQYVVLKPTNRKTYTPSRREGAQREDFLKEDTPEILQERAEAAADIADLAEEFGFKTIKTGEAKDKLEKALDKNIALNKKKKRVEDQKVYKAIKGDPKLKPGQTVALKTETPTSTDLNKASTRGDITDDDTIIEIDGAKGVKISDDEIDLGTGQELRIIDLEEDMEIPCPDDDIEDSRLTFWKDARCKVRYIKAVVVKRKLQGQQKLEPNRAALNAELDEELDVLATATAGELNKLSSLHKLQQENYIEERANEISETVSKYRKVQGKLQAARAISHNIEKIPKHIDNIKLKLYQSLLQYEIEVRRIVPDLTLDDINHLKKINALPDDFDEFAGQFNIKQLTRAIHKELNIFNDDYKKLDVDWAMIEELFKTSKNYISLESSDSLQKYTTKFYKDFNDRIRTGKKLTPEQRKVYEDMISSMKPLELPDEINTLYRSIIIERESSLGRFTPGTILEEDGFVSTSASPMTARLIHEGAPGKRVLFEIEYNDRRVNAIVTNPLESEVIFLPGQQFRVVDVSSNIKLGKYEIIDRYVKLHAIDRKITLKDTEIEDVFETSEKLPSVYRGTKSNREFNEGDELVIEDPVSVVDDLKTGLTNGDLDERDTIIEIKNAQGSLVDPKDIKLQPGQKFKVEKIENNVTIPCPDDVQDGWPVYWKDASSVCRIAQYITGRILTHATADIRREHRTALSIFHVLRSRYLRQRALNKVDSDKLLGAIKKLRGINNTYDMPDTVSASVLNKVERSLTSKLTIGNINSFIYKASREVGVGHRTLYQEIDKAVDKAFPNMPKLMKPWTSMLIRHFGGYALNKYEKEVFETVTDFIKDKVVDRVYVAGRFLKKYTSKDVGKTTTLINPVTGETRITLKGVLKDTDNTVFEYRDADGMLSHHDTKATMIPGQQIKILRVDRDWEVEQGGKPITLVVVQKVNDAPGPVKRAYKSLVSEFLRLEKKYARQLDLVSREQSRIRIIVDALLLIEQFYNVTPFDVSMIKRLNTVTRQVKFGNQWIGMALSLRPSRKGHFTDIIRFEKNINTALNIVKRGKKDPLAETNNQLVKIARRYLTHVF